MGTVPVSAYNAFNLARNGGFEFWNKDGATLPDGWGAAGVVADPVGPVNAFEVVESVPTQDEEPTRKIQVRLQAESGAVFLMAAHNVNPGVFDFPVPSTPPLDPSAVTTTVHIQEGYLSTERALLAHHPFTVSLAVQVLDSPVLIHIGVSDVPGDGGSAQRTFAIGPIAASTEWKRVHVVVPARAAFLGSIQVGFFRQPGKAARVNWGRVCIALGAFDDLPYTGNPEDELWPSGAVVILAGGSCPPGFEPFDVARAGKFPRGNTAIGADGGAARHSHDGTAWKLPPMEESQNILLDAQSGPTKYVRMAPSDNYSLDGPADKLIEHNHSLRDEGNIPTARGVLLCQKR